MASSDRFWLHYCLLTLQAERRHSESKRLGMQNIEFKVRRLQGMCDAVAREQRQAAVYVAFRAGRRVPPEF